MPSTTPTPPAEGLLALPPEVLLLISEFLPIHSTACLACSNRLFSHLLGRKTREALQVQDRSTRLKFLILLNKDRPSIIYVMIVFGFTLYHTYTGPIIRLRSDYCYIMESSLSTVKDLIAAVYSGTPTGRCRHFS